MKKTKANHIGKPHQRKDDHVGPPLTIEPPMVRNQVGDITSYQRPDGKPGWHVFVERNKRVRRSGLRFTYHNAHEEQYFRDFFHGIEHDNLKEIWYLLCYQTMRQRGLWSFSIAAEQRLSDEHWMVQTPPAPAALQ